MQCHLHAAQLNENTPSFLKPFKATLIWLLAEKYLVDTDRLRRSTLAASLLRSGQLGVWLLAE